MPDVTAPAPPPTSLVGCWPLRPAAAGHRPRSGDGPTPDSALRRSAERIEAVDGVLRAFVGDTGQVRRRAGRVDSPARHPGSPEAHPGVAGSPLLRGSTVGVKDIVSVDGMATRAGSAVPAGLLEGPQATVVDRLLAAGVVVAGKTHTAEFASSAPGPTRNPHDPAHTPGGSSSGSAAAVAAGMVPLAIGTQTIGSVIRPAAFCGVVGFVPTWGRVPIDGVLANAPSLDRVGTFTTDVDGALVAAAVLVDGWRPVTATPEGTATPERTATPATPTPDRARRAVLGVPVGPYLDLTGARARERFDATVADLRDAGFDVRGVPVLADVEQVAVALTTVNRYEFAQVHAAWFAAHAREYRDETAATVRAGQRLTGAEHTAARAVLVAVRDDLERAMDAAGIDLWITPAARGPAPAGLGSTGDPAMNLPWSAAGMPAVTLPAGRVGGLPVGLQCIARRYADEQLLVAARSLEAVLERDAPTPRRPDAPTLSLTPGL